MACGAWERLLDRPPQERRFKSTWAAFMLGKACEEDEPDKALQYYKQVRELARHGFVDSVGLAAASLGLEARVYLQQKKYYSRDPPLPLELRSVTHWAVVVSAA